MLKFFNEIKNFVAVCQLRMESQWQCWSFEAEHYTFFS